MNIHVIMIASFWIRQVKTPIMLMSMRINAIADGEILFFMSFVCRFGLQRLQNGFDITKHFFSRCPKIIGQKSVSPSIYRGWRAKKKFQKLFARCILMVKWMVWDGRMDNLQWRQMDAICRIDIAMVKSESESHMVRCIVYVYAIPYVCMCLCTWMAKPYVYNRSIVYGCRFGFLFCSDVDEDGRHWLSAFWMRFARRRGGSFFCRFPRLIPTYIPSPLAQTLYRGVYRGGVFFQPRYAI